MNTQEGEQLRQLLGSRNKAAFAREARIPGGPSMLSQHLSGHRPISVEAAIAYSRALQVSLDKVSPSAATTLRAAMPLLRNEEHGAQQPEMVQTGEPRAFWQVTAGRPSLDESLPVVLDAIAAARDRHRLSVALEALIKDDGPLYRQRVAELLTPSDKDLKAA